MPVEPKPMHDLPAHHLVPDALTPEQIESKAEHVAISKANMPLIKLFVLAMFAGAFVALGAAFFTVVMGDAQMGFAAQRALAACASAWALSWYFCAERSSLRATPSWCWARHPARFPGEDWFATGPSCGWATLWAPLCWRRSSSCRTCRA